MKECFSTGWLLSELQACYLYNGTVIVQEATRGRMNAKADSFADAAYSRGRAEASQETAKVRKDLLGQYASLQRVTHTLQQDKETLSGQITVLEKRNHDLSTKIHELYICTQCKKIMLDPVIADDGETYEREVIEAWLLEHKTSPYSGEVLESTHLIPNNGLRRQITRFLDDNPTLWESDSVYVSKRLTDGLISAVKACNLAEVKRLITIDKRLLTKALTGDQHLLRLSLHSTPEILSAVVEALGDKLADLPEMKTDVGVSFFRIAAQSLGTPGAEITQTALKWGETEVQEQFAYGIQNDLAVVRACLDLGANIESADTDGSRPLHLAVTRGDSRLAQLLVERGADRAALNAAGHSALHLAVMTKKIAMVSVLVKTESADKDKGRDPFLDLCGVDHLSPLHLALNQLESDGHFALLQLLVQAGVDLEKPHPVTKDTALLQVMRINHPAAFTLLLSRQENPADITAQDAAGLNALHLAIELKQAEQLAALLKKGADLESVTSNNQDTALLHAVRKNNLKLLTQLLRFKPDLNLEAKDANNQTALHLAFSLGHIDLVPTLIQAGVHLESTDDLGNTALLRAVIAKRLDLIQMMVERGAKINVSNKQRENALHLIASAGNGMHEQKMVAYLLEQGVSGVAHNLKGKKPDEVACLVGNRELADFISDSIINLKISQLPHAVGSPRSGIRAIQQRNRKATLKESLGEIIKFSEAEFTDTQAHHVRDSFFCSGVFKRRDGQLYVGKSNHIFTEDSAEAYACAEKIALDIYAYFGVPVPETTLARLPIIFPKGCSAKSLPEISDDRTHTVYLMSEILAGFHAVSTVPKFEGGEHFYLQLPGQENVLKVVNFGRMLAVAKIIDDPDILGDLAKNFVCQISGQQINCIKINASSAFNTDPELKVGLREVRVSMSSNDYHTIAVDNLPAFVKQEFLETIMMFTNLAREVLIQFFVRRGTENLLAFHAGRNLREMPQVLLGRQALFKAEYAAEFSEVAAQGVEPAPLQRKKVSDEDISATFLHQKQGLPYAKVLPEPISEAIQYTIHHRDLTYRTEDCIGSGSFAQVYKGRWKSAEVAIKKLILQQGLSLETGCAMRQEAAIMRRLNHPNVMPLYGICVDPGHTSLVFKYLPNGSLFNMINDPTRVLDWPTRLQISLGISEGIKYLHTQSILHRDLKSLNVLLDATDSPVIADFGLSKVKTETHASMAQTKTAASSVGTISWMAPELFRRKGKHTRASDVFALAVILWELSARKIPWSDEEVAKDAMIIRWLEKGERNDIPKNTPKPISTLIARCWDQVEKNRPEMAVVTEELRSMHLEAKTAKDSGTLEATLWSEQAVSPSEFLSEPKSATSS